MTLRNGVLRASKFQLAALLAAAVTFAAAHAAVSHADIYVYEKDTWGVGRSLTVQQDGGSPASLGIVGQHPALASDGQRIAFITGQPGSGVESLAVTDIKGHGPHEIQDLPESEFGYAVYPTWTPNSSALLVSGFQEGDIAELRPVQSQAEWSVTPVITWPGIQWGPVAISPNGSKIAFISYSDPTGKSLGAEGPALYLANRNGSSPERISPKGLYAFQPTFSPDGSKIAFSGVEGSGDEEIYVLTLKNLSVKAITSNTLSDNNPDWRADGRIGFQRGEHASNGYDYGEFRVMGSDGKKDERVGGPFNSEEGLFWGPSSYAAVPGESLTLGPESEVQVKQLLMRYAPKMRYDSQETFRALTANSITDFYGSNSESGESNRLQRWVPFGESPVIAYSDPTLSSPNLDLGFLRPGETQYPNGEPVGADVLSEHGSGELDGVIDTQSLEQEGEYRNTVYGRVKYSGGQWWLQYWFFYYYNPWLVTVAGDHEGDWEMIQLGLNQAGIATTAVFAQHSEQEACSWSNLHTSIGYYGNIAPDVFVARGSHASYVDISEDVVWPDSTDAEYPVPVKVASLEDSTAWALWPGTWGDSDSSPPSPSLQGDKWSNPAAFYEGAASCRSEYAGARVSSTEQDLRGTGPGGRKAPMEPLLAAHRRGDEIVVDYKVPQAVEDLAAVVITASRSQSKIAPTGATFKTGSRNGTVRIPAPVGTGRIVVSGRAISKTAGQSEPATTPVS